jgi:hypothetical protein
MARQFTGSNNGRLLASAAYLRKRGWTSSDTISRAKADLMRAGFIFETVKGQRPNKASWYAITWQTLDRHPGFDPGAVELFRRGAYQSVPHVQLVPAKPTRDELYQRHRAPLKTGFLVRLAA